MRSFTCLVAFSIAMLPSLTTHASIHNLGVDIASDGTQTVVPFFDESTVGNELDGGAFFIIFATPGETLTITLDTAAAFGPGPIVAAELFIDAFDIDPGNSSDVRIQGVSVGSLADTPDPSDIPVAAGPVGTHVANDDFDVDNTFFDLSPFLLDLATDSTFTIEIENTTFGFFSPGDEIRIDGINIQVEKLPPITPGGGGDVPEPASVFVWSLLVGLGTCAAARRR